MYSVDSDELPVQKYLSERRGGCYHISPVKGVCGNRIATYRCRVGLLMGTAKFFLGLTYYWTIFAEEIQPCRRVHAQNGKNAYGNGDARNAASC
mgnify:CR=1 FL=1